MVIAAYIIAGVLIWLLCGFRGGKYWKADWLSKEYTWDNECEWINRLSMLLGPIWLVIGYVSYKGNQSKREGKKVKSWFD